MKITSLIRSNSNQNILDSPLWYNPHLFPVKLHFTNWSKAGIICIKDIVNDQGTVLSTKIIIPEYYRVQKAVRQFIEQNKRDDNSIQVNHSIPFHTGGSEAVYILIQNIRMQKILFKKN